MTKYEANKAWAAAEKSWTQELNHLFGKNVGQVRYTKQSEGAEGSELRRLYDARKAAMAEWDKACEIERGLITA